MCGILGYTLTKKPTTQLMDSFRKLFILTESRGNHAAGVSWEKGGKTRVAKAGKSAREFVRSRAYHEFVASRALTAVAHTRWATNGDPKDNKNNHPHQSERGDLSLVHNGMVFNWEDLKAAESLPYHSECDSEVIIRLIEKKLGRGAKRDAVRAAVKRAVPYIRGSASFALMSGPARTVFLVRHNNPVHLLRLPGVGVVFASEASALWGAFGKDADVRVMAEDTMLTLTGDTYSTTKVEFSTYRVPSRAAALYRGAATGGRVERTAEPAEEPWWVREEREELERRIAMAEEQLNGDGTTWKGWYTGDDTPPTDYMESRGLCIDASGQVCLRSELE